MGDNDLQNNFVGVRVKTDINVTGTRVRVSNRVARILGIHHGMVLLPHFAGEELYLYAIEDNEGKYFGRLYPANGEWRCGNASLAQTLLHGADKASYRCGEVVVSDGKTMISVITRRNYAAR